MDIFHSYPLIRFIAGLILCTGHVVCNYIAVKAIAFPALSTAPLYGETLIPYAKQESCLFRQILPSRV